MLLSLTWGTLVPYFEVWLNFQTFKNESAGHAFLVGFREK
nr:MAG TPA: hypothetical protein [Caudoviricetes sp.]